MIDEIRADYEALQQIAARFSQRAEITAEMLAGVRQAYQPLEQGSWIGEGADAFFAEMTGDVIPAVGRLIAALATAGEITGSVGRTIEEADQAAASPFQNDEQRSSSGGGGSSGGGSGGGSGSGAGGGMEAPAETGEVGAGGGSSTGGGQGGGFGDSGLGGGSNFGSGFGSGGFGGGGSFGGGGFTSPFSFADAVGADSGAVAPPSRFRYEASGGGGGATGEGGFSRPPYSGGTVAEAAAGGDKSGLSLMASMLASSPFLATLLGKLGKKKDEN